MSTLSVDTIQGQTTSANVKLPAGTPVQLQTTQGNFSYQEISSTSMVEVTDMNVTIAAANNASVTGPLTIATGTTLTIIATGRLAII